MVIKVVLNTVDIWVTEDTKETPRTQRFSVNSVSFYRSIENLYDKLDALSVWYLNSRI